MTEEYDPTRILLPDNKCITRIGYLLRSLSLDELPEILNVIKGEMSIVGARPFRMEYLNGLYLLSLSVKESISPAKRQWKSS